ncbi:metal ABC transporter solute-binding protein, Zn/Mn family [Rubidibacter lacunae]|uniref:metal ABC transporter solute-binding protein, Zn/Mn family n=1 Tax=Rubidibacter lacunae TaxID=582514 RepID=UPI0038CD2065
MSCWLAVSAGTLLVGCNVPPSETDGGGDGRPDIVATSTMLTDWTERVGGDAIALTGILKPGDDPHVYEPVPGDVEAIEAAELTIYNGFNLEPQLIRIVKASGSPARAVGESVTPLDFEYEGQTEPDPHVWGDVENAIAIVAAIRDELVAIAPESESEIQANADAYIAELQRLDTWVAAQIATIPPEQRRLVTTHDAFQYYAAAYGLEVIGTLIGISTEEQPSAKTVRDLVEAVKTAKVPAIFAETTINPELIATVAREANVTLPEEELYSDSLGAVGSDADSYIGMVVANTRTITEALGGKFQPFEAAPE